MSKLRLTFERLDGPTPQPIELEGREAWALGELAAAGPKGVTPIDQPGPRWSEYVRRLRRRGFEIVTQYERHAGSFPGNHGRYLLRTPVRLIREGAA